MNLKRLLRLNEEDRTKYIQESFIDHPVQALRHYAKEYGILYSDRLTKKELLDAISFGMSMWAETQLLEQSDRNT